jgi:hypothetical protein
MARQLFLPLHQAHTLITGQATRILVHKSRGDVIRLQDDKRVIYADDGYVRFAAGDRIVIAGPNVGHVCTVSLLAPSETPQRLRDLPRYAAIDFGYPDVCEMWQDYAYRYDHAAHKHWIFCKRKLNAQDRTEVFRSLIATRDANIWSAWVLHVKLESVNVAVQKGQAS